MPDPQTPRFGELLRRLLITKGYSQANVLDDYFPIIDLLRDKPELYRLRYERTFIGGGIGFGAAGVNGRVWIMNRKPSQLTCIELMLLGSNTQVGMSIDMTTIGLPADGAGGFSVIEGMDSRDGFGLPGTTPQVGTTVANDTSNAPAGVPVCYVQSGGMLVIPAHYVLKPGYGLAVSTDTVGAGINIRATFIGYERPAEDSELK